MPEKKVIDWYCINHSCGAVLGTVLGSELVVSKDSTVESVQTRGPNLVVKCGSCGTQKVWYTSDPIVRSIYQLVDATVSIMAARMMKEIGEKSH
jgi:ribosomal protein S27E